MLSFQAFLTHFYKRCLSTQTSFRSGKKNLQPFETYEQEYVSHPLSSYLLFSNSLSCLSCYKRRRKCTKSSGSDYANCVNKQTLNDTRQTDQDGSAKETLSLSTISHTPGAGDGGSASLGDWSTVHQLDGIDASKVNLLCEGSSNNTSSVLGVLNRVEFCDRLESIVLRLERIAQTITPGKS